MTKGKGGWNSDQHPRMTGDVTGDGLADIIGFASKNVSVAVNTGKDFIMAEIGIMDSGLVMDGNSTAIKGS